MSDEDDWSAATWEGNRSLQQRAFAALPLREKLERLEQMAEVAALFGAPPGTSAMSVGGPSADGRSVPQAAADADGEGDERA